MGEPYIRGNYARDVIEQNQGLFVGNANSILMFPELPSQGLFVGNMNGIYIEPESPYFLQTPSGEARDVTPFAAAAAEQPMNTPDYGWLRFARDDVATIFHEDNAIEVTEQINGPPVENADNTGVVFAPPVASPELPAVLPPSELSAVLPPVHIHAQSAQTLESITVSLLFTDKTTQTVTVSLADEPVSVAQMIDEPISEAQVKDAPKAVAVSRNGDTLRAKFSSALFYFVLVAILLLAVISNGRSDEPKSLMGYSIFTVLTRSMQSEIPQYSFIVTHEVDPKTLEIGDDITYLLEDGRTVTHRIIAVYDDYAGTGEVGFETQGIENPAPDADIVYGANVVGKVIFHNLLIGKGLRFISLYWMYLLIPAGTAIVGLYILMRTFRRKA